MNKKRFTKALIATLFVGTMWSIKGVQPVEAAQPDAKYMQDVPLDAAHFPDESFRNRVAYVLDTNKDGILSTEERKDVCYVEIGGYSAGNQWYTDMRFANYIFEFAPGRSVIEDEVTFYSKDKKTLSISRYEPSYDHPTKVMDITGIEYLFNLEEILMTDYNVQKGSLKNNVNLKKVWVKSAQYGAVSFEKLQQEIPLSQLSYLHMVNIKIPAGGLNVSEMPNLEVFRVILPDNTNQTCKTLDLSKNKALKDLELGNIVPSVLDLRKNTKLTSVKVYTGKAARKKNSTFPYYQPKKKVSCKIQFPKKNSIDTLYYFTDNKSLDLRNLTKLEDLHTLKATKLKVKSSWIRKNFTPKKWSCVIAKSGVYQKKVKASKKKVTTL